MATLVLQTAGVALGTAIGGPIGGAIGGLLGGMGGAALDAALQPHGSSAAPRFTVGPRITAMDGIASTEGAGVPRVYGRARLGGQMIWATRFLEQSNVGVEFGVAQRGGKGGGGGGGGLTPQRVNVTYSYFANFAIAICEGPIAFVRRIFADGAELDLTTLPIRIYKGTQDQQADPLMIAKEGAEHVPAYRGIAYVVFERLPLANFGNRIPQFAFEVVRPVSGLAQSVRAVDVIPGAGEVAYQPGLKLNFSWPGQSSAENRHQLTASTDWSASIDALQALCPNLETVALVVAWLGDDLRAGNCTIAPRVDAPFKTIGQFNNIIGGAWPADWSVAGLTRSTARLVSQIDGRAAYGGTPSDESVSAAIRDLKARGLKVTFYPFVMMDVPPGNGLPNPYADAPNQPPFPWRGRITCHPAPGRPGSPDGTAAAQAQIDAFFAGYRNFVLHYANLCRAAGGVDAFLIGSELIGLTRVRSAPGVYPATAALTALAAQAKAALGPGAKLSYAADWTEYGAHVPAPGEVRFPLDPLWASPSVDFVGVDVYWPLSDWRDGASHLDAAIADSPRDLDYLKSRVASGEGYDWYYADADAREAQIRTPITDGLGKPWMFRQKDFVSWWSQPHVERVGGVERPQPTAWVPQSKPIWIVETGCPAVDRGANAPNVFPDPRSSEGALPYFSRGGRDDLVQARFLEAMLTHFDPGAPGGAAANPVSTVYGKPMVDPARIYLWCWDARPFPAFPTQSDTWTDAANWETGHWLNGRLEGAPLDRLLEELAGAVPHDDLQTPRPAVEGFLDGYVLDRPMSPREAIDPLAALFGFDLVACGPAIRFASRRGPVAREIGEDDLCPDKDGTLVTVTRAQESELPREIALSYCDSELDYQTGRVLSRRLEGYSQRQSEARSAAITHRSNAQLLADMWLHDLWAGRETAHFALRPGLVALEPGDIIRLGAAGGGRLFQIERATDGAKRQISARAVDPSAGRAAASLAVRPPAASPAVPGPPLALALDPAIAGREPTPLAFLAACAEPWPGALAVWKSAGASYESLGRIESPATMGETLDPLPPGPVGRFDKASTVRVRLFCGRLASVDDALALAGRTSMAIRGADGAWEIFAFARAELVAERTYRLSRLLRGLGGEEHLAARGAPAGAPVVLLDDALFPLSTNPASLDAPFVYRVGPADLDYADRNFVQLEITPSRKALLPYAPVHARARRGPEGVTISFLRRGRLDADGWGPVEIPLGESREAYEIEIALPGGKTRRLESDGPAALYAASAELADFGAPQTLLNVKIFQLSSVVGRGFGLSASLPVR